MTAFRAPRSTRNHFHEPPSLMERLFSLLALKTSSVAPHLSNRMQAARIYQWRLRRLFSTANLLVLLWIFLLYWGERTVFRESIADCDWRFWEDWPEDARPHRLFLVADPQLVDPHTYPGRPWPLSSLTMKFSDHYLSRVFRLSLQTLEPKSTIFLGDQFDGGREWATRDSWSPDEHFRKYGDDYWIKEYERFGDIFFKAWEEFQNKVTGGVDGEHKLLAGLPGNHDLGFAAGIQKPVRRRFSAFFGEGNRVDILGNHTFVSVDTVSLSAMGSEAPEDLWKPTEQFLEDNRQMRRRAISRAMKFMHGELAFTKYDNSVIEWDGFKEAKLPAPTAEINELPMILLSHVPLYRNPGTPCGPLREHWPPTLDEKGQPLKKDDRNAIAVAYGYQYQNVLSGSVTSKIVKTLGHIDFAFSGDDHDYCDIVHDDNGGAAGIREITVKSISMAMGVRKPGFLQLSLHNPVDNTGKPLLPPGKAKDVTVQTNLCLLPDQIGILIHYALALVLTLLVLAARASYIAWRPNSALFGAKGSTLLPTVREDPKAEMEEDSQSESGDGHTTPHSNSRSHPAASASLSMRPPRTRSVSPARGGYGINTSTAALVDARATNAGAYSVPLISHAGYFPDMDSSGGASAKAYEKVRKARRRKPLKGWELAAAEFANSLLRVAPIALLWYWWLMRNG